MMRWILTIPAFLGILILVPYLRYTSYEPAECQPFFGDQWYNPYPNLGDSLLKSNFHAHSRSWAGLTWGENTAPEIITAYSQHGYQIPGLSNYHSIADPSLYPGSTVYIPEYEHGLNMKKVHCLCIGAENVSFLEFPWHISADVSRQVIWSLRKHCALVALAHPGARHAHVPADMRDIDGIQLMEVANTQGVRTPYWDAALSCGRPVWFLADDDVHALNDGQAFRRWNMIYVEKPDEEHVLSELKYGHHYGVYSYDDDAEDNRLTLFGITHDTLRIAVRDTCNRIDFIGQDGVSKRSVLHSNQGWYHLEPSDTYIRIEVHMDHSVMYLNPVIRYPGGAEILEETAAPVQDLAGTWTGRMLVILIMGTIFTVWLVTMKRL